MLYAIEKRSFRSIRDCSRVAPVRVAILAASLALAAGCRLYDNCPQSSREALDITIVDSISGLPMANGSTVTISDGSSQQTIAIPATPLTTTIASASDRPGTYNIVVQRAGYRDWTRNGVQVQSDGCLPVTVAVTARLMPQR